MNQAQVVQILGEPLEIYKPEWEKEQDITLQFAEVCPGARWFPMLWVHFRSGQVREVYAKRYILWGADDTGVYGLAPGASWESDEFERTFPVGQR